MEKHRISEVSHPCKSYDVQRLKPKQELILFALSDVLLLAALIFTRAASQLNKTWRIIQSKRNVKNSKITKNFHDLALHCSKCIEYSVVWKEWKSVFKWGAAGWNTPSCNEILTLSGRLARATSWRHIFSNFVKSVSNILILM